MHPKQFYINPSILSANLADLTNECKELVKNGASQLHVDIMDGHFVNNLTIGHPVVKCLRNGLEKDKYFLDCHLMVSEPGKWVEEYAKAGADGFTFHLESLNSTEEVIALCKRVKELKMKVGISIKPKTPVEDLYPLLDDETCPIDMILIMSVEPGFGGQSFMKDQMDKVVALRNKYPNLDIQVDGGINDETAKIAAQAGANVLVAGSYVFSHKEGQKVAIQLLKDILSNSLQQI